MTASIMNQDVRDELDRIEGRIANMAEMVGTSKGWGVLWKILAISTSLAQVVVVSVVIPFGTWTVNSIHELQTKQAGTEQWMAIGPRFTATDADRLKLQTKEELRQEISAKLEIIMSQLQRFGMDIGSLRNTIDNHITNPKKGDSQ